MTVADLIDKLNSLALTYDVYVNDDEAQPPYLAREVTVDHENRRVVVL